MGANWANRKSHDFYVYTLRYPDGTVFYVGKGIAERINNHAKEAKKGVSSPKCDVIRSIWETGQDFIRQKEYEGLSQEEALQLENEVIERYNFILLTNKMKKGQAKWYTPERHRQRSQSAKLDWDRRKTQSWWKNKHP